MNDDTGIRLAEKIHEGGRSVLFRGTRVRDGLPVVVKMHNAEYPTPADLARFRHEFDVANRLDAPGIVRYLGLEPFENAHALVIEDFGASALGSVLSSKRLRIDETLDFAIELSGALGHLHSRGVTHKDVNPQNILVNPATGQVKLTDFGRSSLIERSTETLDGVGLSPRLAYISPEQTGRMNRTVDFRTDFYSLGITLFAMLTGRIPFEGEDAMEFVHCHIARRPPLPSEIDPTIATPLSGIVEKLLAKMAEDRYNSAFGLRADLVECRARLMRDGSIEPFELARHDVPERFRMSQKLYGREREIDLLMRSFERAAGGSKQTVFCSGYSGIGKSSLIREIHRPIVGKRGYFISGKFDQLQRTTPFSAFIQAFGELVQQILAEPGDRIDSWRSLLDTALQPNGAILAQMIPELELVLGKQPPPGTMGPAEAQTRIQNAVTSLVTAVADRDHPLALFVDDLQWADTGSLALLKAILGDKSIRYLYVIGAYRDNEVGPSHPLQLTLDELRASRIVYDTVVLSPLDRSDVNRWIADSIHVGIAEASDLSDLVYAKTIGNPFFTAQFLRTLYENGSVRYDDSKGTWVWDLHEIERLDITDNVVELMSAKIAGLSPASASIVRCAACIGARFDLDLLAHATGRSMQATAIDLWEAVTMGLVVPQSMGSEIFLRIDFDQPDRPTDQIAPPSFSFLHDRIQQAAYAHLPKQERSAIHLSIGRRLRKRNNGSDGDEMLFEIAGHLNLANDLIVDPAERAALATLNLAAGRRAKDSAAFGPAMSYLETGLDLLGDRGWNDHYLVALQLQVHAAEAAYLHADFERAEHHVGKVLTNAHSVLDKVLAYEVRVLYYFASNRLKQSVEAALEILSMLGVRFPKNPGKIHALLGLIAVRRAMLGKSIESLGKLPQATDPRVIATMRLLYLTTNSAYWSAPALYPLAIFSMIRLSVSYGNTPYSSVAYGVYGVIVGAIGQVESGYEFGRFSLDLLERLPDRALATKVHGVFNLLVRHSRHHLRETLDPILDVYKVGRENGDNDFAALALFVYNIHTWACGVELATVESNCQRYAGAIDELKHGKHAEGLRLFRQFIANLREETVERTKLIGEHFDEREGLAIYFQTNNKPSIAAAHLYKLILCCLFADYRQGLDVASIAASNMVDLAGSVYLPLLEFYQSLVLVALCRTASVLERRSYLRTVASNQKRLWKRARFAPMNYRHKWELVEAERLGLHGRIVPAMGHYDRSIALAREHGYLHEEALALELAGEFYSAIGRTSIARNYLADARFAYERWGATSKLRHMETRHPELASVVGRRPERAAAADRQQSDAEPGRLDFTSVAKAAQAISGEIVLEALLDRLMRIVMENAGADRGVLMLPKKGKMFVQAETSLGEPDVAVLQSIPLETYAEIPQSVVAYVTHTHENLVLNDPVADGRFIADEYLTRRQTKSVLCTPLLNQGNLMGILYLENSLTNGAFTSDRLSVLYALSSQAAISIENAGLYSNLSELNRAYERFVPKQFLRYLDKESIVDVVLGDQVQRPMTVLFSDVRSFTSISERMTPKENFDFINALLERVGPVIRDNRGFIDKYIGDAIMALFPERVQDALDAAISMHRRIAEFNTGRSGSFDVRIGVGIHTGLLMLGTIGEQFRMEGTVIADAVNVTARLEALTKVYGSTIIISETALLQVEERYRYHIRMLDHLSVRGKSEPITIYEVFDSEPDEQIARKEKTRGAFEDAVALLRAEQYEAAASGLRAIMAFDPEDLGAAQLLRQAEHLRMFGPVPGSTNQTTLTDRHSTVQVQFP